MLGVAFKDMMYFGGHHIWKSVPQRYSPFSVCNLCLWIFTYHNNYACSIKLKGQCTLRITILQVSKQIA